MKESIRRNLRSLDGVSNSLGDSFVGVHQGLACQPSIHIGALLSRSLSCVVGGPSVIQREELGPKFQHATGEFWWGLDVALMEEECGVRRGVSLYASQENRVPATTNPTDVVGDEFDWQAR